MKLLDLLERYKYIKGNVENAKIMDEINIILESMEINSRKEDTLLIVYILLTLKIVDLETVPKEVKKKILQTIFYCNSYLHHKIKKNGLKNVRDLILISIIDEQRLHVEDIINKIDIKKKVEKINYLTQLSEKINKDEGITESFKIKLEELPFFNLIYLLSKLQKRENVKIFYLAKDYYLEEESKNYLNDSINSVLDYEISVFKMSYFSADNLKDVDFYLKQFNQINYDNFIKFYLKQESLFIYKVLSSNILTENFQFDQIEQFKEIETCSNYKIKYFTGKKEQIKLKINSEKEVIKIFTEIIGRLKKYLEIEEIFRELECRFKGLDGVFYFVKKKYKIL